MLYTQKQLVLIDRTRLASSYRSRQQLRALGLGAEKNRVKRNPVLTLAEQILVPEVIALA